MIFFIFFGGEVNFRSYANWLARRQYVINVTDLVKNGHDDQRL